MRGWRVQNIRIRVYSTANSYWVALDISTYDWVVVAIPVLVKSGLCVVVLTWEAHVVGKRRFVTTRVTAPQSRETARTDTQDRMRTKLLLASAHHSTT